MWKHSLDCKGWAGGREESDGHCTVRVKEPWTSSESGSVCRACAYSIGCYVPLYQVLGVQK